MRWQGALANALASFVGSYPWFFTFNFCMARLPTGPEGVNSRDTQGTPVGILCTRQH